MPSLTAQVQICLFNIFIVNTVHAVELLNYYTNHCTYIKFTKFAH